ncbi:hypothetical protein HDV04_004547 [Boothiomyces sp. JEL0838]|nr:hypothetical protein HDV04_004547 [Boothiomyces sp. JEL0838]
MCKKTIQAIKNLDLGKISVYLIIKDIRDLNVINFNLNNVFIDPGLQFFKILGDGELRKMPMIQLLHPKLISNAIKARYEGFLDSPQNSENRILGGAILVSDAGEIVYKYVEGVAGDQPNLKELVDRCDALCNQDRAEKDFESAFTRDSLATIETKSLKMFSKLKKLPSIKLHSDTHIEFNVTIYIIVKDEKDLVDFDRKKVLVDKTMEFFKEYNVNVYVILKDKIDAHHLDYEKEKIFIDAQYSFYKFLGDESGQVRMIPPLKLLTPGPIKEYIKAYYEGFRNTEHLSDNMVLGGTILVSNQKEVLYQFSEPLPGYQPDLNRIVNDCRALKGQETAEQDFNVAFSSDNLLSLGIDFSRIG